MVGSTGMLPTDYEQVYHTCEHGTSDDSSAT